MTSKPYSIIEHTADIGFEVWGDSRETVFESAALAFFDLMWEVGGPQGSTPEAVEIAGADIKELLVNFLEEFLFLYDARGLVCTDLKVKKVTDTRIKGTASLRRFDETMDRELLGVKAVTYHQLYLEQKHNRWKARVFLDI